MPGVQQKRTVTEHSGRNYKPIEPKREEAAADLCQEKVPEADQKKRTAVEHNAEIYKPIEPKREEAAADLCPATEDDRKT